MSHPIVTIELENGQVMTGELYPEKAPNTVNNFIDDKELASGAVRVHGAGHGQHPQGVLDVVLLKAVTGKFPADLVAYPEPASMGVYRFRRG